MSLEDNSTVIPGKGYVFLAPVGTTPPATSASAIAALDLEADTIGAGGSWSNFGHTSSENNVSFNKDGGDSTVKGTWQNPNLRQQTAPSTQSYNLNSVQVSNASLNYYFGGGDVSEGGVFHLPDTGTAIEQALFLVMVDGDYRLPFYHPKVSIIGGDAISVDTENFLELPLVATILKQSGKPVGSIYKDGLGALIVATGATSGTPGDYTPAGAKLPATLADLTGVVATPTSAWATGEFVYLADYSKAHWNGTAWAAGAAA